MNRFTAVSVWMALCCGVTSALAQTSTAFKAPAEAIMLEEVVVTAERREENLQAVPIAVTAISGEQLARIGITDTRELTQAVPSLIFSRSNGAMQPTLRGIGTRGNSAGDESSVALYVDGVYQPELEQLNLDLLKIKRIEVLRGPQGTLFGRNATGGLVNIITPDPQFDLAADATATYGRFDEKSFQGYATGAFTDRVAADLSVMAYGDDGYDRNLISGDLTGVKHSGAARTKLLWKPSDTSKAVLTLNYSRGFNDSAVSNAVFNGNSKGRGIPGAVYGTGPWQTATNDAPFVDTNQYGAALATAFELEPFDLETTTAYQKNHLHVVNDLDGTTANLGISDATEDSRYYQQEVRLLSNGDSRLKWIGGAFFFGGYGEFDPFVVTNGAIPVVKVGSKQKVWSWAPFVEGTYSITDALHLTAGVRYSYEQRHYDAINELNSAGISGATHFDKVTPRGSLQYVFSDRVNVYATYSQGFKSGVFNSFSATSTKAVRPEVLDAYELGIKTDPQPWLRANFAAFHYEYKDIQLSARDASGLAPQLLNAAHARIDGAEAEFVAAVTSELELNLSGTYLDARYNSFTGAPLFVPIGPPGYGNITSGAVAVADKSGFPMIRAPRFAGNLGVNWEKEFAPGTFGATANAYYSTQYYWAYQTNFVQPAYAMVNSQLFWTAPNKHYTVSLWGKNLTNRQVIQQLIPGGTADLLSYERPRTYGISVTGRY